MTRLVALGWAFVAVEAVAVLVFGCIGVRLIIAQRRSRTRFEQTMERVGKLSRLRAGPSAPAESQARK